MMNSPKLTRDFLQHRQALLGFIFALTRDQVLLEGRVAPQPQWGADKVGGGWQVVTAGGRYSGATERL